MAMTWIWCGMVVLSLIFGILTGQMDAVADAAMEGAASAVDLGISMAGVLCLFLPFGNGSAIAGLVLIGLGCAPIYPSIIHATPKHFGADRSQAMIGVQMASAYVGTCLMPPLFGLIANHISASLLPVYLLAILAVMTVMHEKMLPKVK